MVALAWIKSPLNKWKIFVANRTVEIQKLTNGNWQNVKSKQNPADLISRGINAEELDTSHLWSNGPLWLSKNKKLWPVFKDSNNIINQVPEQ